MATALEHPPNVVAPGSDAPERLDGTHTVLTPEFVEFNFVLAGLMSRFLALLVDTVLSLIITYVLFIVVLYSREQSAIAQALRDNPADQAAAAVEAVRAATFTSSLLPCIAVIYLKAALCAAFTLLLSTFATSWIFTIIVSVVVYLIGHVQPIAREYWLASATVGAPTKIFLALVSLIFPDLTAFNLVDDVVAGNAVALGLFLKTAVLGVTYITAYFLAGYFMFADKEL